MRYKLSWWLAVLIVAVAQPVRADDVKLPTLQIGKEIYTNVTVTTVTATDIYFSHAKGMGNAKLKNLTPDLQKKFGFNAVKGREAEKQQAEANLKFRTAVAAQAKEPKPAPARPAEPVAAAAAEAEPVAPQLHAKSFRGASAPSFVVEKWITPKPNLAGKFVLVDFWATWCGPCRRSIPYLNELQEKFKDDLVVVGLSDEPEADIRRMAEPKMNYAVAFDTSGRMMREAQVKGIPHAILIDPKGIVRFEGMPHYLNERGLKLLLDRYGN
jgi:thiol-disulfide isomerase/thioredoxin